MFEVPALLGLVKQVGIYAIIPLAVLGLTYLMGFKSAKKDAALEQAEAEDKQAGKLRVIESSNLAIEKEKEAHVQEVDRALTPDDVLSLWQRLNEKASSRTPPKK